MNQKILILLISISLMISSVSATCGGGANTPSDGKCCSTTAGKGVSTCTAGVAADTDGAPTGCQQGFYLSGANAAAYVCTPTDAGQTSGTAGQANTATTQTDCPINFYCPAGAYAATNIDVAPKACPTDSTTAAVGQDDLNDCTCTDKTQTLDTTAASGAGSCVSTYTGTGGNCRVFAGVATTCVICRDGYQLSGTVCVACEANCDICTASACTDAQVGFYLNGSNVPTACAANCDECTASACTDAQVGFYLNASNVPTACPANCDECTATACTAAKVGYYLGTGSAVTKCPDNSTKCTFSTTVTVTGVAANYFVQTGALSVATPCTSGLSSQATAADATATPVDTAALGCTIVCVPNCRDCATSGPTQCDNAVDNYYVDATTKLPVLINDTNRHPSCLTARGIGASDCLTCRDTDNRVLVKAVDTDVTGMCSCQTSFTESGQTDAVQFPTLSDRSACVACGTGVATCQTATDAKPLEPLTCVDQTHIIVANICAAQASKVDGFFYDTATSQFLVCDATCQTCAASGTGACTACAEFTPPSGITQEDVNTLLKVWTNGTLPATGGVCYSQCPLQYEVQDETRVNCVASSISQIISMIAVFISFIYLI